MKIVTWIKYETPYLPPRCRKMRYAECEEYITSTLKEIKSSDMQLAFDDSSYGGKGKIFFYRGHLWAKAKRHCPDYYEGEGCNTALDDLIWDHEHCSTYFRFDFDRESKGMDTSRAAVVKQVRQDLRTYLVVDGELYSQSAEPRYVINTFGLGCNHGGTGMFVEYHYNPNIRKENYFSALDGDAAVEYANKIAAGRGDTKDVGKFHKMIEVYMPELVKINPKRQHGNGNRLLNDMEDIISGAKDPLISGLLCIAAAEANIANNR